MVKQKDLELYLRKPLEEQRKMCRGKLLETENNGQVNIQDTIVELDIPLEEFMQQHGAVRLIDFDKRISNQEYGTK